MAFFPPAKFEPDKSRYNITASQDLLNVTPVADGWAPIPAPTNYLPDFYILTDDLGNILTDESGNILVESTTGSPFTGPLALPSECRGAFLARTASGTSRLFAGTETSLYEFSATTLNWVLVGSGYAVPLNNRWSWAQFGDFVYVQNGQDAEQQIDINLGSAFTPNATAPVCSYLVVTGDFLLRLRLASNPAQGQWSALNDPTSNTIGLDFSDVTIYGDGNGITGGVAVSTGAIIFLRDGIYALNFTPSSEFVFVNVAITKFRGAVAPYSIQAIGQDDFIFYAADGFYRGAAMAPIGAERVDNYILTATSQEARLKMRASVDYRRKIVWQTFEVADGSFLSLGYDWQLDQWCLSDMDVATGFKAETFGVTWDGLSNLYSSIDEVDIPFDSSAWDGGSAEYGLVTSEGYLAFLNGAPMAARLITNEDSAQNNARVFTNGGRIYGDALNYETVLSTADIKGGAFTDRNAVTPSARTGFVALRGDARVRKIKVSIPAGENWTIFSGFNTDDVASGTS